MNYERGMKIIMNWHSYTTEEVLARVESSPEGLNANQASERLEKNGKNKLTEGKKVSLLKRFLEQLKNPMIIILLAAAAVSAFLAVHEGESFMEVIIILTVVVLNSVLGVVQESKAEAAIEALKEMTAATSKVIRGGKLMHVKSEDLAVGDILVLEAGDAVGADARIIESASLKAEEAALTGESVPVDKSTEKIDGEYVSLGDRTNMVYMGSVIVYGRGHAVVTATGMSTEMGKIADALTMAKENETPLQIKLNRLSRVLSYMVLGISVFIFAFSVIKAGDFSTEALLDTFMIAVSLAVAAIPEGLAAVVTVVLSIGVTNMSKRNAVIRKLTAVETLGCAQIICSDKTGTLTQNKMTVMKTYTEDETFLARAMALCSDAEIGDNGEAVGEPTECALVNFAAGLGLVKDTLKTEQPRVMEAPFDSVRKMMSVVCGKDEGEFIQYTKGAPDEILQKCDRVLKDGRAVAITDEIKNEIISQNKDMAGSALRVLAAAYRVYNEEPRSAEPEGLENELIFIGLTGMIDPVRPEAVEAVKKCKAAGIRPIMITGDHRDTAVAIATELGILEKGGKAITGDELSKMSDEEFYSRIGEFSVYARVQPEHKVRIVEAWQKNGKICAMTGDGVNDAPSIKTADIGVGMGITGTDVTKNVADMVLADDNFATIVYAVEEGRRIYDNIRKSIWFLLASNLSEVLAIFGATVLGFVILRPVHLLWINLVTDSLPALALGMEKSEDDIMRRKPRDPKDGIFANGLGRGVIYQGVMVALITLAAYFAGHYMETGTFEFTNSSHGMTMAFLTMSMAEIFHSFNMRSQNGSIFKIKSQNLYLIGAMVLTFALTVIVLYVPPLAAAFSLEHISLFEFGVSMALAVSVIPIVEVVKFFERKRVGQKSDIKG